jgi:hypothetical protein
MDDSVKVNITLQRPGRCRRDEAEKHGVEQIPATAFFGPRICPEESAGLFYIR